MTSPEYPLPGSRVRRRAGGRSGAGSALAGSVGRSHQERDPHERATVVVAATTVPVLATTVRGWGTTVGAIRATVERFSTTVVDDPTTVVIFDADVGRR
jgi:hypothetical protein